MIKTQKQTVHKLNYSTKKYFLVLAFVISTNLLCIRCANLETDLTFAELALAFEII